MLLEGRGGVRIPQVWTLELRLVAWTTNKMFLLLFSSDFRSSLVAGSALRTSYDLSTRVTRQAAIERQVARRESFPVPGSDQIWKRTWDDSGPFRSRKNSENL